MTENPEEKDLVKLGSYLPRAFTIELLHPDIDRNSLPANGALLLPPRAFATFMHETSHLVQDWSTFRGIMDFLNLWDQVAAVADHVQRSGDTIPFPVVGRDGNRLTPETEYAIELDHVRVKADPRQGWTVGREWKFERYEVRPYDIALSGRNIAGMEVVVTLVDEKSNAEYAHRLGAWEVKEAYAVAVGTLHGGKPKRPETAKFEYLVVDRILSRYFDAVTPPQCIAICHWALQDLAPANTLFALIEIFEQGGRKLPPPDEIYDRARQEALSRDFAKNCRDIVAMLQAQAEAYAAQGNELAQPSHSYR